MAHTDVSVYQEDESPFEKVAQGLKDRGIATGRLGVEEPTKFGLPDRGGGGRGGGPPPHERVADSRRLRDNQGVARGRADAARLPGNAQVLRGRVPRAPTRQAEQPRERCG